MSTGLQRLRMAIVKLNKLQCMPENMSQLLSNKTHMPKNLYQMSSENSYSEDFGCSFFRMTFGRDF
jgi:hypothetical protein